MPALYHMDQTNVLELMNDTGRQLGDMKLSLCMCICYAGRHLLAEEGQFLKKKNVQEVVLPDIQKYL